MTNPYFGDFGDVWKHLVLAELLARLRPRHYWETHAGSASYPLTRSRERSYGVYHFLERAESTPTLWNSRYRRILGRMSAVDGFPSVYPGSSLLAMLELGTAAHGYLLCDVDANSVAGLKLAARELSLDDRVRCLVADGVSAIRRATMGPHAPEPARVLVHVDPFDPFEPSAADEVTPLDLVCELAQRGFTVVLWYGYEDKQRGPGWAWREVASRLPRLAPPLWYGDIGLPLLPTAAGEAGRGLRGCGVVCANLSEANCATLATLGAALASIYQHTTAPTGESDALVFRSLSH